MKFTATARVASLAIAMLGAAHAPALHAQETSVIPKETAWEVTISPYAYHFSKDDTHKAVWLIGLERQYDDGWLWGGAYFSNSFGQKSGTAYFGYIWNNLFDVPALYVKLTAGIMYGYVEPYEDKVPFNHNGWSPTVVPAVGYRLTSKDALQVALLGTAGLLFSYNRRF
ncbi:hypothetical protein QTI66_06835 [Variovorax sp. J22R133]|uniref:hypothetical protein n=1 Tax=Variovorax brevis TaxID=3053503 RepID=UPI0025765B5C|nr:hypothetical protein [Variovorax sp. J22R133]MDM0111859.1 hypothetical protein [Variovorax sp. J22R133]